MNSKCVIICHLSILSKVTDERKHPRGLSREIHPASANLFYSWYLRSTQTKEHFSSLSSRKQLNTAYADTAQWKKSPLKTSKSQPGEIWVSQLRLSTAHNKLSDFIFFPFFFALFLFLVYELGKNYKMDHIILNLLIFTNFTRVTSDIFRLRNNHWKDLAFIWIQGTLFGFYFSAISWQKRLLRSVILI